MPALQRSSLRTAFAGALRRLSSPFAAVAAAIAVAGALLPAQSPSYGPLDPANGFPRNYSDGQGTVLSLCLTNPDLCALLSPVAQPVAGVAFPANYGGTFPAESFYWFAEASMPVAGGGDALLILALEAAFPSGFVLAGEQSTFARLRLRVDNLTPGQVYHITHPYGELDLVPTRVGRRSINHTEDLGLVAGNFDLALGGNIFPFLKWDSGLPLFDAQGNQFVGDPNLPHTVTGSPTGHNFFRIEGPDVGGPGVHVVQTDMFHVLGMVHPAAPAAAFTPSRTSGTAPLGVAFSNQSTGAITSYSWNFGNGQTSSAASPSVIYTVPGDYTVSLTVTGAGGSSTHTLSAPIHVEPPPPTLALVRNDGAGRSVRFRVTNLTAGCKPVVIGSPTAGSSWFRVGSVGFATGLSRPVDEGAKVNQSGSIFEVEVRAPLVPRGTLRRYQLLDPRTGKASNVVTVTL